MELGSGGMGAVYEAVDQRLETTVALKQTLSSDDRLRRQFEQEARLLAQLHHPCLPRVSDYFSEDGRAFLVMQFISGPDLAQILAQQPGPFPLNTVIGWADQLLDALIYLHERDRQIIHRDIKPHNLKVMPNGKIALLDFGLAKTHGADHSTTNSSQSIFGYTRRYSPPEQIRDLGTTAQSDIYALGATLYHLLTGVKPPDSLERAAAAGNHEADPLKPACDLNKAVDPALAQLLAQAMAINTTDRFKSASEFREGLRRLGRKDIGESRPQPLIARKSDTTRAAAEKVDPFDSYSILKPQAVFTLPRQTFAPGLIIAVLAIVLVLLVAAFPTRVVNSVADKIFNSGRATPIPAVNDAAVLHPKSNSTVKGTVSKTMATSSEREAQRKDEPARRRKGTSTAKRNGIRPPHFSLAPSDTEKD